MDNVIVIKRDLEHRETWRYSGKVLARNKDQIKIEAFFNRPDVEFYGMLLAQGDRFVETFFTDRWFNVFEIHSHSDNKFKGLYCNVSYPAEITDGVVSYVDLALDLLVFPDGRQLVLDQDEFESLSLSNEIRLQAQTALDQLIEYTRKILLKY